MLRVQQKNAAIGIPGGIVAVVIAKTMLSSDSDGLVTFGFLVGLAGVAAFWWGCIQLAVAKGYSGWLGAALGLLNVIGIVILSVLPDKRKAAN